MITENETMNKSRVGEGRRSEGISVEGSILRLKRSNSFPRSFFPLRRPGKEEIY